MSKSPDLIEYVELVLYVKQVRGSYQNIYAYRLLFMKYLYSGALFGNH